MGPEDIEALVDEVHALRAENQRLRSLLGLDEPSRRESPHPGSPPCSLTRTGRTSRVTSVRIRRLKPRSPCSDSYSPVARMCTPFVGRVRGPERPDGVPPSWVAGRTPRNQVVLICLLTKEWWSRTSLVRVTSVSTLCAAATSVDSWPVIDGKGWVLDALAYLDAAAAIGVPVALERSRSGEGAHTWTFFSGPVPASAARRLGVHILRQAMELRAELDLSSYDRLFPTQDFVPKGSFGNLIALPLQGECRRQGNTVFLDPASLEPYEDQWTFLASIPRMSPEAVAALEKTLAPVVAGPDDTKYRPQPARGAPQKPPEVIRAVSGAMLAIDRIGVPPALVAALKHLASLHNPEYYEKERLRFSTWNTPRFLRCYRETIGELLLPRGVADQAARMVGEAGSNLEVTDACSSPTSIDVTLRAELSDRQRSALDALIPHHLGVLVAPPGSGKTVIASGVIAHRRLPTLIVVDRQPLVEQWRDRLGEHLGMATKEIGQLGGGRNKANGAIDIAMAQSLARREGLVT